VKFSKMIRNLFVEMMFSLRELAVHSRVTLRKAGQVDSWGRRLNNLARRDVGAPSRLASIQIYGSNGLSNVAFARTGFWAFCSPYCNDKMIREEFGNDFPILHRFIQAGAALGHC
jgi:hypothetical protein